MFTLGLRASEVGLYDESLPDEPGEAISASASASTLAKSENDAGSVCSEHGRADSGAEPPDKVVKTVPT